MIGPYFSCEPFLTSFKKYISKDYFLICSASLILYEEFILGVALGCAGVRWGGLWVALSCLNFV